MRRIAHHRRGQSAAELAVFGAIVIFVIGLIFRASLGMSHAQNMELRAFRMALRESYRTADGVYTAATFSAGRNTAAIAVLEDRLSIDPSQKQGTRDRTPLMSQSMGTMTHALLMKVDPDDLDDLPVFDFFINGQRFPLGKTLNTKKTLSHLEDSRQIVECQGAGDDMRYGRHTGVCYGPESTPPSEPHQYYRFFRKVQREEPGWCDGTTIACPAYSAERRFDLDFDGNTDIDALATFPYAGAMVAGLSADEDYARKWFGWQWVPVDASLFANQKQLNQAIKDGLFFDIDGDLKEERILGIEFDSLTKRISVIRVLDEQDGDMDGSIDDGTEQWWEARRDRIKADGGEDPGPLRRPGIQPEVKVYSFTKEGTYLRNEEGKLYDDDGQYIRNETRQDHLDIIERVFYLSNDTGRFCSQGGGGEACTKETINCVPTAWDRTLPGSNVTYGGKYGLAGMTNPVEACYNGVDPSESCFSDKIVNIWEENVKKRLLTCMDTATQGGPTIFVRSRIRDRRRVRWVTRTGTRAK